MKILNVKDDIYTVLNCSKCSYLELEKCCIENMRCSMGIDTYLILKKPDHCQLARIRSMTVKEIQFNHTGSPELFLVTKEHQIILRQFDFNNPGSKYPQSAWLEILYDGYLRSMGTLCQLLGACLYMVMCIIMTLKKRGYLDHGIQTQHVSNDWVQEQSHPDPQWTREGSHSWTTTGDWVGRDSFWSDPSDDDDGLTNFSHPCIRGILLYSGLI